MSATQATAENQKKTSLFGISHLINAIKNSTYNILLIIRNKVIPLGNRPEAWHYFLQKTVQYNTLHQFLTGCLLMVAFYTYPIILMSMYAHMKSLIIMKDLPQIYAFSVNMILIILCKESIEASFNIFWGRFANNMITTWSKKIDGDKKLYLLIERSQQTLDVRGHISRFCKSFIQLIKNGISRASRIALALTYLLPRTTLPTIGIFFTASMLFYSLINWLNTQVATSKKKYNHINNQYYELQCGLQTNRSQHLGNTVRYENHKDALNENNNEERTIQNDMLLPCTLINYLNSLAQNVLTIVLPIILLSQDIRFEQGALEQAKEAFLRIFLGIDPLSKDAETLSTLTESFDQVQKLHSHNTKKAAPAASPSTTKSHSNNTANTHQKSTKAQEKNIGTTLEYCINACIHATKTSSLYTSILCLAHLSISLVLSNPNSHLLQAVLSLSWDHTLFLLKLTLTWSLCYYLESSLSEEAQNTIKNEIRHTTNFALAATFTLTLLTTINFPVLLANPTALYPGIIALSVLNTLICVKFFKYKVKTLSIEKQPRSTYTHQPTPPRNKNENLVIQKKGSELNIQMKNLVCQWEENGAQCKIAEHTYKEGKAYIHHGPSGGGKSNALQLLYQGFIYQELLAGKSAATQNQDMLGFYGLEASFSDSNNLPSIVISEKAETKLITILIPQNSPTQNIETPVIPDKLTNILTQYFKTDGKRKTPSELQKFIYAEILSTDKLPDVIQNSPSDFHRLAKTHPELQLLEAWGSMHACMKEFMQKFPDETKVTHAIEEENLSLLKKTSGKSVREVLTGGSVSGGQKGLVKAAFCYALLKLRQHSFQICLLLDEPFSETGNNRQQIFKLLNEAVQSGDQNCMNKPMLHTVAHHLTDDEKNCFSHHIEYPKAEIEENNCSTSTGQPQSTKPAIKNILNKY